MAVVQISRIQIRRGQKNQGPGLPQLASGELGWAIDTRELFIGNGSVTEGAPAVGNTKILTQYDNIFSLANSYAYKDNLQYIQTGSSVTSPVERSLQDRLDDIVSVKSFGLSGTSSQDATPGLQRAIDQLYLNFDKALENSRVVLYMEPGVYTLYNTIFLPSFVTIKGAGPEKTVIRQMFNGPIFKTVNSTSEPGTPADISSTTFNNQARKIYISGMTLQQMSEGNALELENCRDSIFEQLDIIGSWEIGDNIPTNYDNSIGINFISSSDVVKCSENKFIDCKIANWGYGILSSYDIDYILITHCNFSYLGYGVAFGVNMNLGSPGMLYGPRYSIIEKSRFNEIYNQAILVTVGTQNKSIGNYFSNIGNNGGTEGQPITPIIDYSQTGNETINDYFTRTGLLSYGDQYLDSTTPYVPEVDGPVHWNGSQTHELLIGQSVNNNRLFRLPGYSNQTFTIDYQIRAEELYVVKAGTLTIHTGVGQNSQITWTDDYDYVGEPDKADVITFHIGFLDSDSVNGYDGLYVDVSNSTTSNFTMKFQIVYRKLDNA